MQPFAYIAVTPVHLCDPSLALTAAHAGGMGILDFEFCDVDGRASATRNLRWLVRSASEPGDCIGLRISASQADEAEELLKLLRGRQHTLIVSADSPDDFARAESLKDESTLLIAELTSAGLLGAIRHQPWWGGFIARGAESGGWVGEDSAFLLAQKFAAECTAPFYVRGGIGPHSAAACLAAGAAGIVLDDQLLLLPESPLPPEWRKIIEKAAGQDCVVVGERLGKPCRILSRPGLKGGTGLRSLAAQIELADEAWRWPGEANAQVGWGDPEKYAWPAGQALGFAASLRDTYGNAARLFRGIVASATESFAGARAMRSLAPESPLAQSHGTRYPIVQGPMTRVSDRAEFAAAVARNGALPFLALALMRQAQVAQLLEATKNQLGSLPWGVGILGFASEELRREQLTAVRDAQPPFALIAGGRPDQAAELEREGIATYIHAPTASLLKMFLEQGARRFVFEGAECGGHVGPFTSFALWDDAMRVLLPAATAPATAASLHILFAGGIHDARSAAMVASLAAPLARLGVRVGVLMGTAYLFTEEAVTSGAIVPGFQARAIGCERTVTLEVGPGHSIRCAESPFGGQFYSDRRRMMAAGMPPAEVSAELERLGLGRLRLASKGIERDGDQLRNCGEEKQQAQGMYMIGQAATMRSSVSSMAELHEEVSLQSHDFLPVKTAVTPSVGDGRHGCSPVAIVGMAVLAPRAQEPHQFWRNLLDKVNTITEIPARYWDWRLFFDSDTKAPDKTYSRWGGFMDDVSFDPVRFGIPPKSLRSISPGQLLVLEAVRRALADAGLESGRFDHENTSVILGSDGSSFYHNQCFSRSIVPLVTEFPEQVFRRLPEWTEESFPGILNNVSAGRVANRFNFGGTNFLVDAACASSLKAVELAVQELETGRSNMVVVGGLDVAQTPASYIAFSKTQALSPRGRAQTFDKAADGIVISEAVAVVILKRLEDAERDGDTIYAIVESVASSSDGKAMGLTAPRPLGQKLACRRAYERAGVAPRSIGLYEAHGTGTAVGDAAELETISSLLRVDGAPPASCAIGSLKSLIGHTKTAAGVLGLIKAALALHHKTLPPHGGVEKPLDPILEDDSPVFLLKEPQPWLAHADRPRRAAVSAFGFGGTNTHAVLVEYRGAASRVPGAADRPCELFPLRAHDPSELEVEARHLLDALRGGDFAHLADLAYTCGERAWRARSHPWVLSIAAGNQPELIVALETAIGAIGTGRYEKLPAHIRIAHAEKMGRLAFLFPGQGSQYPDMLRELALYSDVMRSCLESAVRQLETWLPRPLEQYIYPPAAFTEEGESRQRAAFAATEIAQPAIGAVSLACFDLLAALGIHPEMACGHSFGEFTALAAAGALDRTEFWNLAAARGRAMASASNVRGGMAMVRAQRAQVAAWLQNHDGLVLANHNAPLQCVISGAADQVDDAVKELTESGLTCTRLPVSGAFHSPLMAGAQEPLTRAIDACSWVSPRIPVYSNASGEPHGPGTERIRAQLRGHLLSPVEFVSAIEAMYRDGARIFVECGPRNVLTGLVRQTLDSREHVIVPLDSGSGSWRALLIGLGELMAAGVEYDTCALFAGHSTRLLDWTNLNPSRPAELPGTAWVVNGLMARPRDEKVSQWGQEPHLTADSAAELRRRNVVQAAAPAVPGLLSHGTLTPQLTAGQSSKLVALQAHQETMQRFLAVQEDLVKAFLGVPTSPATSAPGPALHPLEANGHSSQPAANQLPGTARPEAEPVAAQEAFATLGKAELERIFLHLVSEHTGYPIEVLGLDMDLEAEVGVDSIKRIEILDAFRKSAPPDVAESMRNYMEKLTRAKSLNAIITRIAEFATRPAADERALVVGALPAPREPEPVSHEAALQEEVPSPEAEEDCPRYVIQARSEETSRGPRIEPRGLYVLTGSSAPATEEVVHALTIRGASIVRIDTSCLEDAEHVTAALEQARREHGPVQGIVHLAGIDPAQPAESLAQWRRGTRIHVKSLFQLAHACASDLQHATQPVLLSASLQDGRFGREGEGPGSLAAAACSGLLKTLSGEWPHAQLRAVDCDGAMAPKEIAEAIVKELLTPSSAIEIGYSRGTRMVFDAVAAPLDGRPLASEQPRADWVWLLTGGARGITAEIAASVAQSGGTLIVAGRTEIPEDGGDEFEGVTGPALRDALITQARSKGEDVIPARMEARVRAILAAREIRQNLKRMRTAGARAVEYHAADLRDESAVASLLASIYSRFGRLDAVVHGAGIIEDKLVAEKQQASFDRVFDTKADSAWLLTRYLQPQGLRLLIMFGSIAGEFGNPGQADYAASNELLNRLGWWIKRAWSHTRVVTINWGPWVGGMATEPVRQMLRGRGIVPIARGAGVRFFDQEIARAAAGEAEVVAGRGPWSERQHERSDIPLGDLIENLHGLTEAAWVM